MKIFLSILLCACSITLLINKAYSEPSNGYLRIKRMTVQSNYFLGLSPGYAQRWYRNLRIPSFCRMNLCHGSCADPNRSIYDSSLLGMPSLYDPVSGPSAGYIETPCRLETFKNILQSMESSSACH